MSAAPGRTVDPGWAAGAGADHASRRASARPSVAGSTAGASDRRPARSAALQARCHGRTRLSVTGDSPDPTMTPKPVGQGRGGPVRQQVDHATPLQVDQDRPVGLTLASRPVIDAEHLRSRAARQRQAADQALVGIPTCCSMRAPALPFKATPTRPCAAASRSVRCARDAIRPGGRSTKVCRKHAGLRQYSRRTASSRRTWPPRQGRSAGRRTARLWTAWLGSPQSGQRPLRSRTSAAIWILPRLGE